MRPTGSGALIALLATLLALGVMSVNPASAQTGPTVSIGNASGLERDNVIGSVFVPVVLSAPAAEPVVVSFYTVNDTAIYIPPEDRVDITVFGDYQRRGTPEIPRTVTIPAGAVQTTINVPINIDSEVEPDEQFSVVIASVSGANAGVGNNTGTATIIDADGVSAVNPAISVSSVGVHEGNVGQRRAQFQIHLSRPPTTNVTVSYSTSDGSATAGADYITKFPGTVVFAPGQISKTIDVLVNPNTLIGTNRSFLLVVDVTGGSPVEELQMTGTATILDDDQPEPLPIRPGLTAGSSFVCVLDESGAVRCWGANALGQFGDGTTVQALTPRLIAGLTNIAQLSAGDSHTCALSRAGAVTCWGNNLNGQLGNGTNVNSPSPVGVQGLGSGVVAIASGDNHSCAVLSNGTARCWGWGTSGQLGSGLTGAAGSSNVPVQVVGIPAERSVVQMAAGFRHTCARLDDGSVRCWGRNTEGQLGTGNNTASAVAVQVVGVTSGATDVSARGPQTCVVQSGGARCFGLNATGQLGNGASGSGTNRNTPQNVTGLQSGVDDVEVGQTHVCARVSGSVRCWGSNQEGQLGVNLPTLNLSSVPVQVVGLSLPQTSLASGAQHSCARDTDGDVRCWGFNDNGQLGNGTVTRSFSPVLSFSSP